MQIIDILRYHLHIEVLLQIGYGDMCGVGFGREKLLAALIIELNDQRPVAGQRLGCADILDTIICPQAIGIAEGRKAAIGTHACTCENNNLCHMLIYHFSSAAGS